MNIEQLEEAYRIALREEREAVDRRVAAKHALDAAKLAEATATGHEWLGKSVWRDVGLWNGGTRVEKGIVSLYDFKKHYSLRGRPYGIQSGELIVISHTGKSAYSWSDSRNPSGQLRRGYSDWALAE